MKGLLIGLVLLVLFVHFGGPNVPKVLKDNKQMVYGVTIGLVLCSFFGVKVEGLEEDKAARDKHKQCLLNKCTQDPGESDAPLYCECKEYLDQMLGSSADRSNIPRICTDDNHKGSFSKASANCLTDN